MQPEPLGPAPAAWRIGQMTPLRDRLILHLEPVRGAVACPMCETPSTRVYSRYYRQPWDLPWRKWPVQLVVQAQCLLCDMPTCPRQLFVEPSPGVLARYPRQTERLRQVLLELAHASSSEMAARVAPWLGYRTSPDTLTRRQRVEAFVFTSPRVLGVDAFALRRGATYGTLLVDLECRQPVATLEERTAESLLKWLQAHPSVAILVRDRAGRLYPGRPVG